MAVNTSLFPDLARTGYQITSPMDPTYNCIAWAVGDTARWWWPDPGGFDYWPPGVPRDRTLDVFLRAFATAGFVPCSDGLPEQGWVKVALYASHEGPTHAARLLANGRWTSKLGPDEDIEHDLAGLVGALYGSVVQFLRRPAT
jgi:hypothetical protein